MRGKWVVWVALCSGLAWGEFELGEWNQSMPAAEALPAAKALALRNNRPLVVMVGNSVTCHYCQQAEANVFTQAGWKSYARAKGLPQYYADGAFADSNLIKRALHEEYNNPEWPTALIFRIKETADLTTTDLDQARNVELIGKFIYRQGRTINGITVSAPTPANFIAILESCYRTTRPAWLNDAGGSIAVSLTPPAAVSAGARWSTDGGATWRESGTALHGAVGNYTITCNAVGGWNTPAPQAIALLADQTRMETALYTPITTGTLTVTLAPAAAVSAGARWSIDGGANWCSSGASLTLEAGSYTVSFKTMSNWTAPASLAKTIAACTVTVVPEAAEPGTATYVPGPDDADPADDVPAGATPLVLRAGVITASTARSLNGVDSTDWFRFEAEAGQSCFFMARSFAVPAGADITFAIYSGVPGDDALPLAFVVGMATLGLGLNFHAAESGTYYAQLARPPAAASAGLTYTLTANPVDAMPAEGDMTNPLWNTAAVGKWTMDYAAAAATGKPMLVLFTGIRWCPYCIAMDAIAMATSQFQSYVNEHDLVLVLLDNPPRNGQGPSLLREQSYLTAHGLTPAEGEAKLVANLAFQQSLVLPGSTRIGYPTVLYLRAATKTATPSVVGRVNYDVLSTDLNAFLTQLEQLEALAADAAEERDNYAGWTQAALVTPTVGIPVTVAPRLGGLDSADWRTFTPARDTGWSFAVRAGAGRGTVAAGARLTVGVYDASGTAAAPGTKLAETTGVFADGVTLEFRPPAYGGTAYRLCVQVADQPEVVDYTLTYTTSVLSYEAQFADATFAASQQAATADVDVRLDEIIANGSGGTLRYWTEDVAGSAQAGREYAAVANGTLSWAPGASTATIHIPLLASGLPAWDGSLDFRIRIAPVSNCEVVGSDAATVRIYSKPTFTDAPLCARTLSTGAGVALRLGIVDGLGGTLAVRSVSGDLPPGLSQYLDPTASVVILSGRPSRVGTYSAVLEARTTVGGVTTVGGQITVQLTVRPVAEINPAGVGSFVGTLLAAGEADVRGTVTLTASATGRLLLKLALRTKTYSYTLPTWSRADQDGTLWVEYVKASTGESLTLSIAPTGRGLGSFTASAGTFDLELARVPWNRTTHPASEYAGYYTVSLPVELPAKGDTVVAQTSYRPCGGGYLVFTVGADGKTSYSGQLADSTRFGGSTTLVETLSAEDDLSGMFTVFVPLYGKGGDLAGMLNVVPLSRRLPEVASVSACALNPNFEWSYPGQSPARGRTADAFTVTLAPCGAPYAKGNTLEKHGIVAAEFVTGKKPDDAAYAYKVNRVTGYAYPVLQAFPSRLDLAVAGGRLTAPAATAPIRQADGSYTYNGSNDSGLKLTYAAATGVFSGSFKLYYDYPTSSWQHKAVTVTFAGVLTPIPGACCTEDPLPLGHGFFLVSDANAEAGYTFKRSYPVWLGELLPAR